MPKKVEIKFHLEIVYLTYCAKLRMYQIFISVLRDDFRLMPIDTNVAAGDVAVLQCLPPRGNPKPTVTWTKDGEDVFGSNSGGGRRNSDRISISDQGNLVIRDAAQSDAGEYECRAHNMVGSRSSEPANLRVFGENI